MADQIREYVVSYLTLRRMIGWVGLLMPFTVRLIAYVVQGIASTDTRSARTTTPARATSSCPRWCW